MRGQECVCAYMEKYPEDADALGNWARSPFQRRVCDAVTYLKSALDASEGNEDAETEKNLIAAYEYMRDFVSASNLAREFLEHHSDPGCGAGV